MASRIGILALTAALLAALGSIISPAESPPAHGFGWVDDPAAVDAFKASLKASSFASTDAGRSDAGLDDVYLWDACRQVTGKLLPARDQGSVGACVGFGTAAAVEHLLCVQAAENGLDEFRTLAPEIIYAGSRFEIGGGRIKGDGSVGAWAARFIHDYGVLPRAKYPRLDLTTYDANRCRQLGRTGVPDDLEPLAKQHPVKTVANVTSWKECQAAIRQGYPLIVCSNRGFGMARDAEGFCPPQGTWMHCMAIVGIRGGARPGAFLLNSWGDKAHTGPLGPGNPPNSGFWADAAVIDVMLKQGDSWAFSQFEGFPAKTIDWNGRTVARH